ISSVANNAGGWYSEDGGAVNRGARADRDGRIDRDRDGVDDRAEGAAAGAGIGAALGGTAGLLTGLGLLAIPGLGPVVAAGWLATTALGAAAGAASGGIIGALTHGVSKEDAPLYAEGVRRGGTLVSARVPDADRTRFEAILDRSAVNLRDRSTTWQKSGWKTFDPSGQPYGSNEVQRERELYRAQ